MLSHIIITTLSVLIAPILAIANPRESYAVESVRNLQACLTSKHVATSLNSSSDWASLIDPYNLRLQYTPSAVTLPNSPQQVSDSVLCAVLAGVKVQARSGGHSYGSFSLGGQNGSLVVDLRNFNNISLDKSTGVVTVGGGVRLGNLGLGIYNQGQQALPHGTYPGVGIGGHYTHGGFGYSSRRWGLALDTIVAMDVVLADGRFVHVTPVSHPDLYYALRGAADSIGIITTFYLQTKPAPARVVSYSSNFSSALMSADAAADVVLKLQTFVTTSPYINRNLTLEIYTSVFGEFTVRGWYFGDMAYFSDTVFPAMLNGMPTPSNTTIQEKAWLTALEDIAEGEPLTEPLDGYNNHQTFYTKSVVTREAQPLSKEALTSYFRYITDKGLTATFPWETFISLYGGKDSQINIPAAASAAYSHRDSLWVFQNVGSSANRLPPFSPEITTFVNGLNTALTAAQPDGNFLAYPNYLDPALTPVEAANLYYGRTTYRKLVKIKSEVDPNHVFWNPQAIGNAVL
ncbi:Glucooligosaccharide oxidase [Bipolaris oryzae ATCC 44560]|uniref:Glucooligosaccharide oxidase n=1 Tax=Bipolaris oryzae ATCC 44560 TaxID=930090 RepID=W6YSP2_COCMI|nr:Glucooligosaccharide oxidase [Bipolaris oryzae ATCC 44560]EUC40538.1 Glucooligosaccharide oxidase [Bipolaris oryzae ATCC 44560]